MHPNEPTLNDYADDALTGAARADVERHLDECAACRGIVEELRAIARAAKTLTSIDPPPAARLSLIA
jgi:anti-sigma factor RsiW